MVPQLEGEIITVLVCVNAEKMQQKSEFPANALKSGLKIQFSFGTPENYLCLKGYFHHKRLTEDKIIR